MTKTNESVFSEETREIAKNLEENLKALQNEREYREDDTARKRDNGLRDYARVLYSSSFRRLQGKMQLIGIDPTRFHRNRLTHSLEVAQIARGIATDLGINSIFAETASLAHDLGNPPFGHYGEKILNDLASKFGGFEGNAQTLRILRTLEKKLPTKPGLNLTYRTLLAVVKYYKKRECGKNKKFIYDEDYEFLEKKECLKDIFGKKTIDAQIMDLADEIAYAAHDLEDALSFGFLCIEELIYEFKSDTKYKKVADVIKNIAKKSKNKAWQSKVVDFLKTSEEYSAIFRKELTSNIVNTLVKSLKFDNDKMLTYGGNEEVGCENCELLAKGLKKLLFKIILRKNNVQLYEKKGEKVIRGLFEVYNDPNFNKDFKLMPPEYRALKDYFLKNAKDEICEREIKGRLIIDYIAGMMDSYAISQYCNYFGKSEIEKIYFKLD